MSYVVRLTDQFEAEIRKIALWWADHRSVEQASRWYYELLDRLATLTEHPERFPVKLEARQVGTQVREMPFGLGSHPSHRVFFRIVSKQSIEVFSIQHVHQDEG